jgi:aspartyl-tRNA(Asn)/glutamyl-tRNA(Gln) amidotransferase subunit B
VRVLEAGGQVRQVTMGWNERAGRTVEQRSKETSEDYRYFPEPDLPPLRISPNWVDEIQAAIPELSDSRRARFVAEYGLSRDEASLLVEDRDVAGYFEAAATAGLGLGIAPKTIGNWVTGDLFRLLKSEGLEIGQVVVQPEALAELVALIEKGTITANSGKTVLGEMFASGRPAGEIVEEKGLAQISDQDALAGIVDQILADNADQVAKYRAGKETLLQWFVGQVMRATRGKANPQVVVELLEEKLRG